MQIEIQDDFDLKKISISGQCFRVKCFEGERYRFISGDKVIYIQQVKPQTFSVSATMEEWEEIWRPYFDLDRCYCDIFNKECKKHPFVHKAMLYGQGLRILRQEPWEMLITFILSQRKNIPAISKSVEMLSSRYGHRIETEYETLYSFPSPQELSRASVEELKECSLGYRAQYVFDAIWQVLTGKLDLDVLFTYEDERLLEELQKMHGIGKKVANCIALFAYGRMACVPIDVWISRAIEEDCKGESPFPLFKENAGIIQQYVFYYERHHLSKN
ncbi:MAG: DNA-3-methyladenine glycosylase 2 family protein [Lachnospiraceae bacterium]|jgi:N-glycosylase/DNA lyase|nr:DNA-3-methyladenine glycosylase 2 family protein [Lachnospiraceae bacterium]